MQQRHVTWAKWAAGFTLFAGVDTALGTGAVQALAELCLTDAAYAPDMQMAGMPMEHRGHAMPWLIAGSFFASCAGFGSWVIARRASLAPWAPRRRPILAGLVSVAHARGGLSSETLSKAWNETLQPGIAPEDATIAMARFGTLSEDGRRRLMATLTDEGDRAALICIALRLLREHGDPTGAGLSMIESLAADLGMSGLDIIEHWEAAEAPSRAAVAVGEARALGAIATRAVLTRGVAALSRLQGPAQELFGALFWTLGRASRSALLGFVRAFSVSRPARSDDQLAELRRRFRRRSLRPNLARFDMPSRMPFRRGLS